MYYYDKEVALSTLIGLIITEISGLEKESDEVLIKTECGKEFKFLQHSNK